MVAGRYIVVRFDDGADEQIQIVSVDPTNGTLATVGGALATGDGTSIADAMLVDGNKAILANSIAADHVRVFTVALDGSTEAQQFHG